MQVFWMHCLMWNHAGPKQSSSCLCFLGLFPPYFCTLKMFFCSSRHHWKAVWCEWDLNEWEEPGCLWYSLFIAEPDNKTLTSSFFFCPFQTMIAVNTSRTGCSALTLKLLYNSLYTQYGIASVLHKSHCRYTVNHTLSVVHEKCSCEVIENSQRLKSSSKCKRAVTFGLKQTCTEQKIDTTLWYLYSPVPSVSKSGPIMFFLIICLIL